MADIKLSQVKSGGSSLDIGDYIETERTASADGKVFLNLDESLLNAGTYPKLAATFGSKYKMLSTKPIATTATATLNTSWGFCTDDDFLGFQIGDGQDLIRSSLDTTERTTTTIASVSTGYYPYDVCASQNGQYIAVLTKQQSTHRYYVWWSDDFGATFTSTLVASNTQYSGTPVSSSNNPIRIMMKPDGSVIRIAGIEDDLQTFSFYESTDFGASWTQVWVGAAVYPSLSASQGEWSDDAEDYVCLRFQTSIQSFVIRSGVVTNIAPLKTWTTSNAGFASISGDGLRIGYSLTKALQNNSKNIQYYYTDDDGVSWETNFVKCDKVNQALYGAGSDGYVTNTMSTLCFSRLNKDYAYVVIGRKVATAEQDAVLVRLYLPTGAYEILSTVSDSTNSPLFEMFSMNITCQLHSNGLQETVSLTSAPYFTDTFTFGYGQYLLAPESTSRGLPVKIVADAP